MHIALIVCQFWLGLGLATQQSEPDTKMGQDRIVGVIEAVSAADGSGISTVTIQTGAGRIEHKVRVYNTTAISYQGKSSSLGEIKAPRNLDCTGIADPRGFIANSCTVR